MPLFNIRKSYEMKAKCYNCGYKFVIRIPRGMLVDDFFGDNRCICVNCGTKDIGIDVPNRREK